MKKVHVYIRARTHACTMYIYIYISIYVHTYLEHQHLVFEHIHKYIKFYLLEGISVLPHLSFDGRVGSGHWRHRHGVERIILF